MAASARNLGWASRPGFEGVCHTRVKGLRLSLKYLKYLSYNSYKDAGKLLALSAVDAADAVACFELVRNSRFYQQEERNGLLSKFIEFRPNLEPEFVSHVLAKGSPNVVKSLLLRAEDLSEEARTVLFSRRHRTIRDEVLSRRVLGHAPRAIQEQWASSEFANDLAAVCVSPGVDPDLIPVALSNMGSAKSTHDVMRMVSHHLSTEFGAARAAELLVDAGFPEALFRAVELAPLPEPQSRMVFEAWAELLGRQVDVLRDAIARRDATPRSASTYGSWAVAVDSAARAVKSMFSNPRLPDLVSSRYPTLARELHALRNARLSPDEWLKAGAEMLETIQDSPLVEDLDGLSHRERVLQFGSPVEVAELVASEGMLSSEELRFLGFDRPDFSLRDLDDVLVGRFARSPLLVPYVKFRIQHSNAEVLSKLIAALDIADAAEVCPLHQMLLVFKSEFASFFAEHAPGVRFSDLLQLSEQLPNLTVSQLFAVLGDDN